MSTNARDGVTIQEVTEVTDELVDAWEHLLPQLSRSAPPLTRESLERIVASEASTMLLARTDDGIVGSATMVVYEIPVGRKAWVEDVVVDESARGRGVGELLTRAVVERARAAGARTVNLTSSPDREAANRLYQRIGFAVRATNVYRHSS